MTYVATQISTKLWHWEPWIALGHELVSFQARHLWLALYTSPEAKRTVPGLYHGPIAAMSSAARISSEDTLRALDKLLAHDLVEYDQGTQVLRLCLLPDAAEAPPNGKCIRGWWRRFNTLPECQVRDAHVPTLRWMIETHAKVAGRKISTDHEDAWRDTFAQVPALPHRRRGIRRILDSDTSTSVQASLFSSAAVSDSPNARDTVSDTVPRESAAPGSADSAGLNDFNRSDTVWHTVGSGTGSGSGSGSGSDSGSPERASQEITTRPRLALVPPPLPFSAVELLATFVAHHPARVSAGVAVDQPALEITIRELVANEMGLADVALGAAYVASRRELGPIREPDKPPGHEVISWLATPGALLRAIQQAREHERRSAEQRAELQERLAALGMVTTKVT